MLSLSRKENESLIGVEFVRVIKKGQLRKIRSDVKSPAEQFYALADE